MVQNFLLETACTQLVKENTRSEIIKGREVSSSVGTSDHLGTVLRKSTRTERSKPNTVKKRSYKSFKVEDFLTDILESDISSAVTAETFERKFKLILDKHAPIKVFQMRKSYSPFISEETKLLMEERKVLKEEMTRTEDISLAQEVKIKSTEIKKAIESHENTTMRRVWMTE